METATVSAPATTSVAPSSAPASTGGSGGETAPGSSRFSSSESSTPTRTPGQTDMEFILDSVTKKASQTSTEDAAPVAEETADETPAQQAEAEPPDAAEKPAEPEKEAKVEEQQPELPLTYREALKMIPNKATRKEMERDIFLGKAYRDIGMPISEAKEFRQLFPTLQEAKMVGETAQRALDLRNAFASGTPEGYKYFIQSLQQENPQAFGSLIDHVADNLYNGKRDAFLKVAARGVSNLAASLRESAKTGQALGDIPAGDLAVAADIVEKYLFGDRGNGNARPQRPPADPRVMARLQQLEQREAQYQGVQREQFTHAVRQNYQTALDGEVGKLIKEVDPDGFYDKSTTARIRSEIADKVRDAVLSNPHAANYVEGLYQNGDFSPNHMQAVANHLVSQAKGVLPQIASETLRFWANALKQTEQKRQAKMQENAQKRDVGSAQAGAAGVPQKAPDLRGMTDVEKIDAMLKFKGIR
jgi:hypothetical protein